MHKIKVRWVILDDDNKIFLVREIKKHFYYLPWWTLEKWKSLRECLNREIIEELWIKPIIWDIISIREFENSWSHQLDIWFDIKNYKDYKNIDKAKASHAYEYYDEWFYSFDELTWKDVKPWNVQEILNRRVSIDIIH